MLIKIEQTEGTVLMTPAVAVFNIYFQVFFLYIIYILSRLWILLKFKSYQYQSTIDVSEIYHLSLIWSQKLIFCEQPPAPPPHLLSQSHSDLNSIHGMEVGSLDIFWGGGGYENLGPDTFLYATTIFFMAS